jgi:MerR family mercuric resistance operon transcriptional regulator
MWIGKLANGAGVGVETVRFYESKGLITQPPRPADGGYRDYPIEMVHHIRFIRNAQQLGFSLKEVKELLALESGSDTQCGDVRVRANAKLNEIEEKIAGLNRIKTALVALIEACPGKGSTRNCSILSEFRLNDQFHRPIRKGD